jgi:hypothetical protein
VIAGVVGEASSGFGPSIACRFAKGGLKQAFTACLTILP